MVGDTRPVLGVVRDATQEEPPDFSERLALPARANQPLASEARDWRSSRHGGTISWWGTQGRCSGLAGGPHKRPPLSLASVWLCQRERINHWPPKPGIGVRAAMG